jgi:hypothetical protein
VRTFDRGRVDEQGAPRVRAESQGIPVLRWELGVDRSLERGGEPPCTVGDPFL